MNRYRINRYRKHQMDHHRFAALAAGVATALASVLAQAAPPPTSPAPVVNYEYDANGNLTKTIQAKDLANFNFKTENKYDALNRMNKSTNAKAGSTEFGYDGQDNLTSVKDPRKLETQYPRNGLGAATSLISPDTGTATNTYDVAGNVKTRTDSRGVLATYGYDDLQRLSSLAYTQAGKPTQTYAWVYDQTGADYGAGIGRLSRADHPNGANRYVYDIQGRLTTEVQRINAVTGGNSGQQTLTVGYGYDAVGRVNAVTYPSGRKLTIVHTSGQPTGLSLAKDAGSAATVLVNQIQWEPFGGVKSWQWNMASGFVPHNRSYDTSGRLVRYPLRGAYRDLVYDAADRIKSYTHSHIDNGEALPALDQAFVYDALGRLTDVSANGSSWTIDYDENGNRKGVTLNGVARAYTTPVTSNRLTALTNPARSFGHDVAGNTESDTSVGYVATYDLAGRLATLKKGGVTTTYSYDNQGRRIRKFGSDGAASTVLFAYDLEGRMLGEYDRLGRPLREYVWLGSTPVAVFTPDPASAAHPPIAYYIHADHLDTPRMVLDRNDKRRWRWMAEPFGTTAPEINPDGVGVFQLPLRHPGQYADVESGLFYNWNRYFDPSTGRYVTSDPIGLAGGINTYAYVDGDAVSYADPEGLYRTPGGFYTPYRPRPRFPNPRQPRPSHEPGNPWEDAAGYFDEEGEFVCVRWKCEGEGKCFRNPYDSRGQLRRSTDFLPSETDPKKPPEGCVCDAPRFQLKGRPKFSEDPYDILQDVEDVRQKWTEYKKRRR